MKTISKTQKNSGNFSITSVIERLEKKYHLTTDEKQKIFKLKDCLISGIAECSEGGFNKDGKFISESNSSLGQIRISYFCFEDRKQKYLILGGYHSSTEIESDKVLRWRSKEIYRRLVQTSFLYEKIANESKKLFYRNSFRTFASIHRQTSRTLINLYQIEEQFPSYEHLVLQFRKFQLSNTSAFLEHCLSQEKKFSADLETLAILSVTSDKSDSINEQILIRKKDILDPLENLVNNPLVC